MGKSKYYLYIDECGDHNLVKYNPIFPVFTLCGILISEENRNQMNKAFNKLKMDIFGKTDIIIHSSDLRRWKGDFEVLKDEKLRTRFLDGITDILSRTDLYIIVSCTILKEQLTKFCVRGEEDDVYGLSLAYLIERSIFCVDNLEVENPKIEILVEERGKNEDTKLRNYYNRLRSKGTKWVDADRLVSHVTRFEFEKKKNNVIGLQVADLIAYPVTIHLLYPERENRPYEAFKHNIFSDDGRLLGQKVIPH